MTNASGSLIWSSNGAGGTGGDVSNDMIPGIDEKSNAQMPIPSSTPTYANFVTTFTTSYSILPTLLPPGSFRTDCVGHSDGACNTDNILAFYNTYVTSPSPPQSGITNLSFYAAGACRNLGSDWYLPAICEMGSDNSGTGSGCGGLLELFKICSRT